MNAVDPASYDAIQPLIEKLDRDGNWVKVVFRCPLASVRVEAQGRLEGAKQTGKGRRANSSQPMPTQEGIRRAIQRAFRSVQTRFVWEANRWISAEAAGYVLTDFVQLHKTAPVRQDVDRKVLARMLAEAAGERGELDQKAVRFLASFVSSEELEAAKVGNAGDEPLTAEELSCCSTGLVRDTMLMFAWGVTLAKHGAQTPAEARLGEVADWLGIVPPRAAELKRHAQTYIFAQALERAYSSGDQQAGLYLQAMRTAHEIGIEQAEIDRIDARLRKRLETS